MAKQNLINEFPNPCITLKGDLQTTSSFSRRERERSKNRNEIEGNLKGRRSFLVSLSFSTAASGINKPKKKRLFPFLCELNRTKELSIVEFGLTKEELSHAYVPVYRKSVALGRK